MTNKWRRKWLVALSVGAVWWAGIATWKMKMYEYESAVFYGIVTCIWTVCAQAEYVKLRKESERES